MEELLRKLKDLETLDLPNTELKAVWLDDVINLITEEIKEYELGD